MLREIRSITSFTTDGSDDIIRAIKYTHPHTLRQRCLVHVERECLLLLTQHPRTSAGITLRRLVRLVNRIRTHNDRIFWLRELDRWHDEYGEFIRLKSVNAETGEMSYTHDKVRKAYVHLKRAIPNMFKFLDRPDVPKNTILKTISGFTGACHTDTRQTSSNGISSSPMKRKKLQELNNSILFTNHFCPSHQPKMSTLP